MVKKTEGGEDMKSVRYDDQVIILTPANFLEAREKAKQMGGRWQYDTYKGEDGKFEEQFSSAITRFYHRFMWDYILIEGCRYFLDVGDKEYLDNYINKNVPDINSYNKKSRRYKITRKGKAVYYSFKNEDSKADTYKQFKEAWAQGIMDKGVPKAVKRRRWQTINKFINHTG